MDQDSDQWLITLQLGNTKVKFRIDTGADETVITDHVYNELQDVNPLKEADKKLFGVGSKNVLRVSVRPTIFYMRKTLKTLGKPAAKFVFVKGSHRPRPLTILRMQN